MHTRCTQDAHTCTHTEQIQDTHIHRTQYTEQIQDTHIHLNNTEHRYNNHAEYTEQNNTGAEQRTTQNLNAHTQHNLVHIVLIFIIDTYISKNSIT